LQWYIQYAKKGGIVMVVDCTELLNERHLYEKGDRLWEMPFESENDSNGMGFDDVVVYKNENADGRKKKVAIVSYGNGVLTSLRARNTLMNVNKVDISVDPSNIDVIDVPLISRVSQGLANTLPQYDSVVFADICKGGGGGGGPLSGIIRELGKLDKFPANWDICDASGTYNPLGDLSTFLNERDIIDCARRLGQ